MSSLAAASSSFAHPFLLRFVGGSRKYEAGGRAVVRRGRLLGEKDKSAVVAAVIS